MKEATIITPLHIPHVLRGEGTDDLPAGMAEMFAYEARRAAETGYREHVLEKGRPDDITIAGTQIFTRDDDAPRRADDGRKHTRWKGTEVEGYTGGRPVWAKVVCTGCGFENDHEPAYCELCGARMDAEDDDGEAEG